MTENPNDQTNLEPQNEEEDQNQETDGATTEGSEEKEQEIDYKTEFEKLKGENERLKQQKLNELTDPDNLDQLRQRERAARDAKLQNTQIPSVDLTGVNLDELTLAQYDQIINKKMEAMYADIVKNKVVPLKTEREQDRINQQIRDAAAKYKDFWTYQPQMVKLARKHDTLSADDVYWLAKKEAGDLSVADEKVVEKRVKEKLDKDKKAGISEKPAATISGARKAMKKMTAKEAATAAYHELFKGG